MKICLVTTPIRPNPTTFPPFGSMAIIQSLESIGEKVSFFHIDYFRYTHDEIEEYFKNNQFDMVGVSAVVSTAYSYTKYLTSIIKNVSKKTVIFLGGGLAASAEILHRKANIDYCVVGDGEIISQNLVKAVREKKTSDEDLQKIKGITYIDSQNKFKFTGYDHPLPAPLIERPDYSILENINCVDHYIGKVDDEIGRFAALRPDLKFEVSKRIATVVVAKGCVARCTFCHRFEKGYRVSPLESIIDHLQMLKDKYNVKYLVIGDENFGSYKDETQQLVIAMNKMGFYWKASGVRAHTVDPEMLKLWKDNGCLIVEYGTETGSPTMLEVMEKKITLEQNIQALKWTYEAGLSTIVQLVIGMPGETDKTVEESIDFLIKLMPYYPDSLRKVIDHKISINYAQALPGTPLYEYARENGFINRDLDSEEKYLIDISDKNAYSNDHFINYTQQPLLKVLGWRYQIYWSVFREHAKRHLKISLNKWQLFLSIFLIIINRLFKTNFDCPANKAFDNINKEFGATTRQNVNDDFFNTSVTSRLGDTLRLFIPWNKITYPFISILIAYKESNSKRPFLKLIFDHIVWSLSFKKLKLPTKTLRKVVKIDNEDPSVLLRKGR